MLIKLPIFDYRLSTWRKLKPLKVKETAGYDSGVWDYGLPKFKKMYEKLYTFK